MAPENSSRYGVGPPKPLQKTMGVWGIQKGVANRLRFSQDEMIDVIGATKGSSEAKHRKVLKKNTA